MEKADNESIIKELESILHLAPGQIELQADIEHASVPTARYEELIRAETERDILLHTYHGLPKYYMENVLKAVFGPRPEAGEPDAQ